MFPRWPFSTEVTWKKFLFTRGLFSKQICQDNYDNRLLFRIFMVFSYKRGDHPCLAREKSGEMKKCLENFFFRA